MSGMVQILWTTTYQLDCGKGRCRGPQVDNEGLGNSSKVTTDFSAHGLRILFSIPSSAKSLDVAVLQRRITLQCRCNTSCGPHPDGGFVHSCFTLTAG